MPPKPAGGAAAKTTTTTQPKKKGIAQPKPKQFRVIAHVIDVFGARSFTPGELPDLVVTATITKQSMKYTHVVRQAKDLGVRQGDLILRVNGEKVPALSSVA